MDPIWLALWSLYVTFGASSALEFVGCFQDRRDHALPYNMYRVTTVMGCIDACWQNELPYAGLQDGEECYCGTDYAKYGMSVGCGTRCRSGEICGGRGANSVYRVDKPLIPLASQYVGCYEDKRTHAMSKHYGRASMIEHCIQKCRNNGFRFAGMERGEECFCGNQYDKYGKTKICRNRCRSGEICGGDLALSVYNVDPIKSKFEFIGCFKDSSATALSHFMTDVKNVEMCIELCRENGLPYAGLQAGYKCFCGKEYNSYGTSDTCDMKCPSMEICGGQSANSVFKVGKKIHDPVFRRTHELFEYVGCFHDKIDRSLKDYKGTVISVDECVSRCKESKALYAGLQYGTECYCGTDYNRYGSSFHCVLTCSSGQICGGHWTSSVYKVGSPDCSCSVSGDPHYKTFDGEMIHFMGTCKYTLAMATEEAPEYFAVEVKNEHRGSNRVSYTRMVDIKFELVTIRLLPGNVMLVNGRRTSPPLDNYVGISAKYSGGWMTVSTQWGLQVQFDGRHRATVKVPGTFARKLTGICGDCNGKKDDLRTKNGTDVSKDRDRFSKVGKSHQVKDDSDKPESSCDVVDVKTKCTPTETQRCDVIQQQIFKNCRDKLGDERVKEYLGSCKIDACVYHNDSKVQEKVVCEAIEGLARACEMAGFPLDWRGASKCAMTCPSNHVYQFNASVCQPSCTEPQPKCEERQESCVCKAGYILSGKVCVPKDQCGCIHNKMYMKVNEDDVDATCQTKTICKTGGKLVTEKLAPCQDNAECSVENGLRGCHCKKGYHLHNGKCYKAVRLGCFKDDANNRALNIWMGDVENVKQCLQRCREAKQPFAGLQFGYGCRCGRNYYKYGKGEKCDKKCKSGENCGGFSKNMVYKIDDLCKKNTCKNGGKCTEDDKTFTCECKEPFYGEDCSKKRADCKCSVSGDPHYRTFDGQMIHFMGICKYTMATSTKEAPDFFAVEVKNEHRGNTRVSYTRMADIKLANVTIRLLPGHKMLVNGEKTSPPVNDVLGFSAKFAGGWITVSTEWGLQVQFDGRHRVNVKVPGTFANKLSGICGDCNGIKDDLRTKNGTDVSKDRDHFSKVGKSHQVKDDSDKPESSCNVTDVNTKCTTAQTQRCNVIQHKMFNECSKHLGNDRVQEYLKSCTMDACIYYGSKSFFKVVCDSIEGFVRECEEAGFAIDWRGESKCAMTCAMNKIYKFNALVCQPSCTEPQPKCEKLEEACVCKDGYVLSGEDCVPKSQCGCLNKGTYMKVNEEVVDSTCQTKTVCKAGGKLVTEKLAPCQGNTECNVENGQRTCACKKGFYRHNGKCFPGECEKAIGDVVFLLDDSQHMLESSSEKVKHFVKGIVSAFNIGDNGVRVGSVSFSNWIENNFHLNHHSNVSNLLNAIDAIKRRQRMSFIDSALDYLRTQSFTAANGDRPEAPNVAIIITDGKLEMDAKTLNAARIIINTGVIMFVIGVGKDVEMSNLAIFGSEPTSDFVYTANNFDALDRIRNNITKRICSVHICDSKPCGNGGKCLPIGNTYECQCTDPFQGKHCSQMKPDCSCSVSGDPHYRTFDGQMIHFMGTCKYTLAASNEGAPNYFAVEVKNEHRGNKRVSYTRLVDIKLKGVTIRLMPGNKMLVNGESRSLPMNNVLGFSAKFAGGWITVSTTWGLRVQFDGRHRANVKVPATFIKKVNGICGDCNGKKDDLRTKNGTDVSKDRDRFSKVGKSHQVKDDSDKPETRCESIDVDSECKPAVTQKCDVIQHPVFKMCAEKLGRKQVEQNVQSCKIDACSYHNDSKLFDKVVCKAIEGFARECEEAGFPLNWREISKCEMTCPANQKYQYNALVCQPSCTEPQPKCTERAEACVCKDGFILSGKDCVPKSQCGCNDNGVYMKVNEEITDSKCQKKIICKAGSKLVVEKLAPCKANSECSIANGQRTCVCKKGFELRDGQCKVDPCFVNPCKNAGKCTKKGDGFICQCKEPFYAKDCSKKKPDCRCSVSGDPHYRTFDGQMIHFMGICKYTLATSTKEAPHPFAVEVKNEHRGNTRVSYTRMADVKLPNVTIRLLPKHKMLVNGQMRSLPINSVLGFSAKFAGGWITVSTTWGLQVQFDGRHRVNVKVPATFANKLSGICGDCNGKKDDLRTKNGTNVSKNRDGFSKIGKSHQVKDDSDKPETCEKSGEEGGAGLKCTTAQIQRCDVIQNKIFSKCTQKLGDERVKEYLDSCKIDACAYHDNPKTFEKVVCEAIEGFARECEEAGFSLDWRGISKCKMACSANEVYQFNAFVCQPSCTEPQPKCEEREEACVCKNGYILSGENCVPKDKCGCMHNGVYMKVNEEVIDEKCQKKTICKSGGKLVTGKLAPCKKNSECNVANGERNCVCKKGFELRYGQCKVDPCFVNPCKNAGKCIKHGDNFSCRCKEPFYGKDCSKKKPDCTCSVSGDPHYRTFDGQMIHFMGICKYTLATSTKEAPHSFAVEVKNEHRGNTKVSYTRMVDVKANNVTIRLLPKHKIHVDGEELSPPILIKGVSAKFASGWMTVSTEWGLQVQFDGRHRANVKVPATFANKLTGICGDCNGKKDDLRTKDGTDVSKDRDRFSKVGSSHNVTDDSEKPELRCKVTDVDTTCAPAETKRCELIQHPVFEKCRQKLGAEQAKEYVDSCKLDACTYRNDTAVLNSVVCEAIEGFARECEDAGFSIDWRLVSKCAIKCEPNQEYKFNALVCQPSCAELLPKCKERKEACVCKAGFVLSGETCVPINQCGCLHNGIYMKVNQEIIDSNCQSKAICKPNGKLEIKTLSPCQTYSTCSIENGQRTCICDKGFVLRGGKCTAKVDPCQAHPCQNGGKCIAEGLTRSCDCIGPFDGDDCSKMAPDCVCSASGDPHYKTFDGQWIHFMGTCKYTLAAPKISSGLPKFEVEVKNEHRGNKRVAYTRLVDLKLHGVTMRLLQGNKIMVNGELMTLPLMDYLGITAKLSAGWITVSTEYGIKVQFDGRHRVTVRVPNTYRHEMTGICGDCNGKKDDYKTKQGVDVSGKKNKFSLLGDSYRVFDDSDKREKSCFVDDVDETCKPSETKACNTLKLPQGPFAVCLAKLGADATEYYNSCVIDSCAYKNDSKLQGSVLCQAFENLAMKCEEIGIFVDWRGPTKCPMSCTLDKQYSYRTSVCQPSCTSRFPVCDGTFTEGCVCKRGMLLSGRECVLPFSCGCTYNGMYMKLGSSVLLRDCSKKITCLEGGHIKEEQGCGDHTMCAIDGGTRRCVCKNGYQMLNGICRKVDVPQPPIIDPEFLGPVMHMFVRVSIAYLKGTPLAYTEEDYTVNTKSVDVKTCATMCLKEKKCKSFNYDQLEKKCVLLSINAENTLLVSSDCPYKDYYQLIDSKTISIQGATMLSCINLESVPKVNSWSDCLKLCADKKCKAAEYSSFKKVCSMTHDTRKTYGLTGDELWNYHETIQKLPERPENM